MVYEVVVIRQVRGNNVRVNVGNRMLENWKSGTEVACRHACLKRREFSRFSGKATYEEKYGMDRGQIRGIGRITVEKTVKRRDGKTRLLFGIQNAWKVKRER
jgi:hypothetical protein